MPGYRVDRGNASQGCAGGRLVLSIGLRAELEEGAMQVSIIEKETGKVVGIYDAHQRDKHTFSLGKET